MSCYGRLAPSPSGRMHLGNLCSALLAWLSARGKNGNIILRLEDVDTVRCRPEYCRLIKSDFALFGIDWDYEAPLQSTRSAVYSDALSRLGEKGLIYPCFCSRRELRSSFPSGGNNGRYIYSGRCRGLSPEKRQELSLTRSPAFRITVPDRVFAFDDGVVGHYEENLAEKCGDFILRRSDGIYAYQLAAVTDDGLSGVTEVTRGADLLSSTPRQLWLQECLGFDTPSYFHTPLIISGTGGKLSKRGRSMDLGELLKTFSPEEIIGRLAFVLGLQPFPEPLTPCELIAVFSWDKIPKNNIPISSVI